MKKLSDDWRMANPERALATHSKYRKTDIGRRKKIAINLNRYNRVQKQHTFFTTIRSVPNKIIRGKYSENQCQKYLGCSIAFFKQHLQSKFAGIMSWENYADVWEIDHIIPVSSVPMA